MDFSWRSRCFERSPFSLRCAGLAAVLLTIGFASDAEAFQVQGLFQIGPSHVGVAFDDSVNVAQAGQASNYLIAPSLTIQNVVVQENQQTVYLRTSTPLALSTAYQVGVSGVTSKDGTALSPGGPTQFTSVATSVMGIDQVQQNIGSLDGQPVSVIGQVFMMASNGPATPSGYIQDGTGRGINLFGGTLQPVVDGIGNVVLISGTADQFFTTVEIINYTATLLAAGMPHLAPKVLTVAEASSPNWEGTYIRTTATLSGEPAASGPNNFNYPAEDGGAPFTFRIRNATGIDANDFDSGNRVTGAGAGAQFQSTFQVLVGRSEDFGLAGAGDTTPPTLVSASGSAGQNEVEVIFSEAVGTGATTNTNYTVFPTASPGNTIAVTGASVAGSAVTLTLIAPLSETNYTVRVSNVQDLAGNPIAPNSTTTFTAAAASGFEVAGAFQFGSQHIGVAFSDSVNAAQAVQAGNYSFSPSLSITGITLQDNQQTVIIEVSTALTGTSHGLTVSGVTSRSGASLDSPGPFNIATDTVSDIADVQANSGSLDGQTVTVIGQVFIPTGSRDGAPSGYIQDGSSRGINLFGGAVQPAVDNRTNVVKVTGTVDVFFTTVEITNYTVTLLATGLPLLAPRVLTVAQANSSDWEGTYIQTTADLTSIAASGSNNFNYDASDGSANITFRVGNGIGIDSNDFSIGETVTGRGAGSAFQSTFQVSIGNTEDFFKVVGDMTPPILISASGSEGESTVSVVFSEAVGTGANVASNYTVFPTGSPGSPIAVSSAAPSGATVTLTLASALATATGYTVRVSNVQDLAGNTIAPNSTTAFSTGSGGAFVVVAAFQFGSKYVGVTFSEPANPGQATTPGNYTLAPGPSIAGVTLQENGQTAIIETSAALSANTSYTVDVSSITSAEGTALSGPTMLGFQSAAETITDIETIHADIDNLDGQTVTIFGQVFIPVSSRGGIPSGYIQDGSGRGINVFGGSTQAAVDALGNVVKVTGDIELFFTTVEITGYTATLIESGQPHLGARVLTVPQANSPQWEGTFIETRATLTDIAPSGSSNFNYDAIGGGAAITFRIGNGLGVSPDSFSVGDVVVGRGAGGAFQSTFQINIGNLTDFFKDSGTAPSGPPPASAALRAIGGGPFPPVTLIKNMAGAGELFEFQISGTLGAQAVCRIFDLQGRLVKVLFDGALTGTQTRSLSWDARSETFEFVPAGMYICHLETTDANGNRESDRAPIVVATRLD